MRQQIHVRNICGRYPGRRAFRADNITATVTEIANHFRIRLDDEAHPEMWLELTLDIEIIDPAQLRADENALILGEPFDAFDDALLQ